MLQDVGSYQMPESGFRHREYNEISRRTHTVAYTETLKYSSYTASILAKCLRAAPWHRRHGKLAVKSRFRMVAEVGALRIVCLTLSGISLCRVPHGQCDVCPGWCIEMGHHL